MIDISVKNLVKAFEDGKNILDGLSFDIHAGERVGILGINGAGKTTLFRLLAGEYKEDQGEIFIAPGKRVGLISQIPAYPKHFTTEDVLKTAHRRQYEISRRLQELAEKMATEPSPEIMREYDRLNAEFEVLDGYNIDVERNRVANGLDIPPEMRSQPFDSLSGGEKTRVNLARLILENTDILLLDEPTNHLDMRATEWLEEYLLKFKGTVLAISHDRYFLDRVVQRCIEIVNGRAEFYSGNYSFYVVEKQRRYEEQLKQYEKEQKEIKRLDEAARRLQQWGTGNEALMKKSMAIRSRMERMQKTERPAAEKKLRVKFSQREFYGDEVLVMEGISKSFGGRALFSDVSLTINPGERIALIGDNGTGKSTLIKIIMGEEQPDTGWIRLGPAVKKAYLPQVVKFENPHRSVLDTLIYEENCTHQSARNRLGAFKFTGEDVFKPVSALSGGELSRLRLCMLMRDEINFLILDEPTNHLDLASREWIEEALSDYGETLLFVSHDRYFIDRFATRIWELSAGKITDFKGGFTEYRQFKERQAALQQIEKNASRKNGPPGQKKKEPRKKPQNLERQMAKLEREIEKLEAEISELDKMAQEHSSDYQRLLEIDGRRAAVEAELDRLYVQWDELSDSIT
ncbi:MAG: ribosomal protection-like ABC-F family protein [Oscillospiraceae bacterium]|jgi:ATP-binding cassette subfamily F protein 3